MYKHSLWRVVDFREWSATYGYENDPIDSTAVRNFGQCAKAWPSEIVGLKKVMVTVKTKGLW